MSTIGRSVRAFGHFAFAHPIAIPAALGALLRILHHAAFVESPLGAAPILDAELYDALARGFAAGNWLGDSVFYFNPLYPYVLGLVYRLFGPGAIGPAHLLQHGLGVGTVVLVALAARMSFGPRAALFAGLLAATYRPFLLYEELLVTETLVVFTCALGLVLTLRAGAPGAGRAQALIAGLAHGVGLLARPTLASLAALIWLWRVRSARAPLVALAGIALAVAPVTLRNAIVAPGTFTIITAHGGETFYVGNRRGADGSNRQPDFVRSGPRTEHEDFRREASRRLGREVDLATAADYWRRQALAEIVADPAAWLRLLGKKAALLASDFEKGDNEDPGAARQLIPIERLPLPSFGPIAFLALVGTLALRERRRLRPPPKSEAQPMVIPGASLLLGLTALAYAAGCLLVFVTARYRLPLVVSLLPVAGEGMVAALALVGAVRRAPGQAVPRLTPLALVAIGGLLVALYRPLPAADRDDPAIAAVNLGVLKEAKGDLEGAIASYRRAIALRPELALGHFNLGVAERRRGQLAAADSAFREALRLDPRYADALDQLAMTHEQAGDLETARVLYERAIAIDSTRPRYYRDLGRLHVLRGDAPGATAAWERALRLDPGDSTTAARLRALRAAPPPPPSSSGPR